MAAKQRKDQEFRDLCDYVKKEILRYPDDMKFPKYLALKIRGLNEGKFVANKKQKPQANYPFSVILMTFKACKYDIQRGVDSNEFKDERHKINYLFVIVENNINDIVNRLKNKEKSKEKVENMELDNMVHEGVSYKDRKIKNNKDNSVADRLKDLW